MTQVKVIYVRNNVSSRKQSSLRHNYMCALPVPIFLSLSAKNFLNTQMFEISRKQTPYQWLWRVTTNERHGIVLFFVIPYVLCHYVRSHVFCFVLWYIHLEEEIFLCVLILNQKNIINIFKKLKRGKVIRDT